MPRQRDGRCDIEAFIVTAFVAMASAIVALSGVVGFLYREVRKAVAKTEAVARAEADCRVKLAELKEQLAALTRKGDRRQKENRSRLRKIERKDGGDPAGDTPCPTP